MTYETEYAVKVKRARWGMSGFKSVELWTDLPCWFQSTAEVSNVLSPEFMQRQEQLVSTMIMIETVMLGKGRDNKASALCRDYNHFDKNVLLPSGTFKLCRGGACSWPTSGVQAWSGRSSLLSSAERSVLWLSCCSPLTCPSSAWSIQGSQPCDSTCSVLDVAIAAGCCSSGTPG